MRRLSVFIAVLFYAVSLYGDQNDIFYKWSQLPDMTVAGTDVYNMFPVNIADDWMCLDGLPITDIHWWGSYTGFDQDLSVPVNAPLHPDFFIIAQYADVAVDDPSNIYGYSHPGLLLNFNLVYKGQYTVNYFGSVDKGGGIYEHVYQFNYIFDQPWLQEQGSIYWLDMSAVYMTGGFPNPYGWHTSGTQNLDAYVVNSTQAPGWILGNGSDLAFEISTVPEPGVYFLFIFGSIIWFYKRALR